MKPNAGFGHLDSLVDEIQKKQSDHVKLESQLRQQRQRAESEAAEASRLKADLEAAAVEKLSLQKRIGLLSRKNGDLAGENAKLLEEKCDFQRSMANNEAKLRENESDLRAAQKSFVDKLDEANAAYSRNRTAMNKLAGRNGAGCTEIPSPAELDALKAAAASAQEFNQRAAEAEAYKGAAQAESKALKYAVREDRQKLQSLRQEVAALKDALKSRDGKNSSKTNGAQMMGTAQQQQQQWQQQQQQQMQQQQQQQISEKQQMQQQISELEQEVARLLEKNNENADYTQRLEEYANIVDANSADLRQQLVNHGVWRDNEQDGGGEGGGGGRGGGAADSAQQDHMEDDTGRESVGGQDLAQPARKESDAVGLPPAPSQGGKGPGV